MGAVQWLLANWSETLVGVLLIMGVVYGILKLIPGDQKEGSLKKAMDFLSGFLKKK